MLTFLVARAPTLRDEQKSRLKRNFPAAPSRRSFRIGNTSSMARKSFIPRELTSTEHSCSNNWHFWLQLFFIKCKIAWYSRLCSRRLVCTILSICTNYFPDNRLAVTTLRTPDARSAQSNIVIVRSLFYAPSLRGFRLMYINGKRGYWQDNTQSLTRLFVQFPNGKSKQV